MVDKCELAYEITYNPIYRLSQIYTFLVGLLSIFTISYFIFKKLLASTFHPNLKFLLNTFFGVNLISAIYITSMFAYHVFQPLFVDQKCDLLIPPTLLQFVHIPSMAILSSSLILPVTISIERFVAMRIIHKYEKVKIGIGPILALITITFVFVIVWQVYKDATFNDNFISFILIPTTSAKKMNLFYWFLFFVDVVNLIINCILLWANKTLKHKYNFIRSERIRRGSTLTVRFGFEEIITSTKFAICTQLIQLLFFSWYLITIIVIRQWGSLYLDEYHLIVARAVFMVKLYWCQHQGNLCTIYLSAIISSSIPTYNLVIGIASVFLLDYIYEQRITTIRDNVLLKFRGKEGALNHDNAIMDVWNSVTLNRKC